MCSYLNYYLFKCKLSKHKLFKCGLLTIWNIQIDHPTVNYLNNLLLCKCVKVIMQSYKSYIMQKLFKLLFIQM